MGLDADDFLYYERCVCNVLGGITGYKSGKRPVFIQHMHTHMHTLTHTHKRTCFA